LSQGEEHSKYNFDGFIIPNWPVPSQESDGSWIRVWTLELNNDSIDETRVVELEKRLSNEEIDVIIHLVGNTAKIEMKTRRWSLEDDLITYSYKILREVNDCIAKIKKIQGQERDSWHSSIWYGPQYKL
jgi:hypothetical protein